MGLASWHLEAAIEKPGWHADVDAAAAVRARGEDFDPREQVESDGVTGSVDFAHYGAYPIVFLEVGQSDGGHAFGHALWAGGAPRAASARAAPTHSGSALRRSDS